jgi:hypothetical protein
MKRLGQSKRFLSLSFAVLAAASAAAATNPIEGVVAHSPVDAFFSCTEHFQGQFKSVGDALGTDCVVMRLAQEHGRAWLHAYENQGATNEQWYGWLEHLLAPCDCRVIAMHVNPNSNEPGVMGEGRASSVIFLRADGVRFVFAHVRDITVKVGDRVHSGQPFAMIGNNGYARNPHVHVGAWKGDVPLQIRWDQRTMQLPPEFRPAGPRAGGG